MRVEQIWDDTIICFVEIEPLPFFVLLLELFFVCCLNSSSGGKTTSFTQFFVEGFDEVSEELLSVLLVGIVVFGFSYMIAAYLDTS